MGLIVQIILSMTLLLGLVLGALVLGKAMADQKTRTSVLPRFLLAEALLMAAGAAILVLFVGRAKDHTMLALGSAFVGMLLNVPAVIVLKVIELFTRPRAKQPEPEKK